MSRLTKRNADGTAWYNHTAEREVKNGDILDKLAHYEDLEEQGRLIELPCLPNEPVWVGHVKYSFDELFTELKYTSIQAILKAMEDGFVIGRTKEDVKRKLAELKEGAER